MHESRAEEMAEWKDMKPTEEEVRKALHILLEYNWKDEEEDFLNGEHTAPIGDHILGSMITIDTWLKNKHFVPHEGIFRWFNVVIERVFAGEDPRALAHDYGFPKHYWDIFDRLGVLMKLKEAAKDLRRYTTMDAAEEVIHVFQKYEKLEKEANKEDEDDGDSDQPRSQGTDQPTGGPSGPPEADGCDQHP